MRRTKVQLREDIRLGITEKTANRSILPPADGALRTNTLDSTLHLDQYEDEFGFINLLHPDFVAALGQGNRNAIRALNYLFLNGGGSGGGTQYIFAPTTTLNGFPTTGLTGKDFWLINNRGRVFYLNTAATDTIDNVSVFPIGAANAPGRWIALPGGTGGSVKVIELRWAVTDPAQRDYNLTNAIVLNGVTGILPDIKPDGIISLSTGLDNYQVLDFTVFPRFIRLTGTLPVTEPNIFLRYTVPGEGDGGGPGNPSGPAFTISEGDQIDFTTGTEQLPGIPDIQINARPQVVTNQLNAPGGSDPGVNDEEIMVFDSVYNRSKTSRKKITAPRWVAVPASNATTGRSGQMARNTTTGDLYSYSHGQWWWDNAPSQAQRKTFTT